MSIKENITCTSVIANRITQEQFGSDLIFDPEPNSWPRVMKLLFILLISIHSCFRKLMSCLYLIASWRVEAVIYSTGLRTRLDLVAYIKKHPIIITRRNKINDK